MADDDNLADGSNQSFKIQTTASDDSYYDRRGISSSESLDDSNSKLFVGGLNWETTNEGLRKYFEQFGELIDSIVMKDPTTGRSRGFGFVKFADPSVVENVLNTQHILDNKHIDPKLAVAREDAGRPEKIFVGGLAPEVDDACLVKYFEQFGVISEAFVMMDRSTGESRGFGFVTFEGADVVERILSNQDLAILGKSIEVKRAMPKSKIQKYGNNTSAPYFNPMGRRGGAGGVVGSFAPYTSRMGTGYESYGDYSGGFGGYGAGAMGGLGFPNSYGNASYYGRYPTLAAYYGAMNSAAMYGGLGRRSGAGGATFDRNNADFGNGGANAFQQRDNRSNNYDYQGAGEGYDDGSGAGNSYEGDYTEDNSYGQAGVSYDDSQNDYNNGLEAQVPEEDSSRSKPSYRGRSSYNNNTANHPYQRPNSNNSNNNNNNNNRERDNQGPAGNDSSRSNFNSNNTTSGRPSLNQGSNYGPVGAYSTYNSKMRNSRAQPY